MNDVYEKILDTWCFEDENATIAYETIDDVRWMKIPKIIHKESGVPHPGFGGKDCIMLSEWEPYPYEYPIKNASISSMNRRCKMMTYHQWQAEQIAMVLMLNYFDNRGKFEDWYLKRKERERTPKLSDFTGARIGWL